MDISVHTQPNAHPVKTEWVDDALAGAYAAGDPLGALIGRPLAPGDGIMLVGWPESRTWPVSRDRDPSRPRCGQARYMQVVEFSGPRSEEWAAAEQRAAAGRLGPATDGIDGIVSVLRLRAADNAYLVVVLAETMDGIRRGPQAIMSTGLLPGEDPELLSGPDQVSFYRLVHADLPITGREPGMTATTLVGAGTWTVDTRSYPGRVRGPPPVRADGARDDSRHGRERRRRAGRAPRSGSRRRSTPPRSIPVTPAAMVTFAAGASSTSMRTR